MNDLTNSAFGKRIRIEVFPHVKKFDVYIDVGACYGETSYPFLEDFKRVISFEPNPNVFSHLPDGIEKYNIALGDEEKTVTLVLPNGIHKPEHASISRFTKNGTWGEGQNEYAIENVPCKTLDSFDLDDVDLIKIDTEGYELNVCKGAIETIKKYRPAVYFETKQKDQIPTIKWFDELGLGYKLKSCKNGNTLAYVP